MKHYLSLLFILISLPLFGNPVFVGDWKVWPLEDGYFDLDQKMFVGIDPERLKKEISANGQEIIGDLAVRTEVYGFLVDTGDQLLVIDAGCGSRCGPTTGKLLLGLQKAGYSPDQVDAVLITHMHGDHFCGLLQEDKSMSFPNAKIYVDARDAAYFRDPAVEAKADEESRPWFAASRESLAPYEALGRLHLFGPTDELIDGIQAIDAAGHTPGHTAFLLRNRGFELLVWGDTVHTACLQFTHPEWYVLYDVDSLKAIASRKRLFELASSKKWLVGGAHLPKPGLGFVTKSDTCYHWQPLSLAPTSA